MFGENGDAGEEALLTGGTQVVHVVDAALYGSYRDPGLDRDRFDLSG